MDDLINFVISQKKNLNELENLFDEEDTYSLSNCTALFDKLYQIHQGIMNVNSSLSELIKLMRVKNNG